MALRNNDLSYRPNPLHGYLTTREAADHLHMSYWHFMHLVEANRIPGIRIVDRWLFSPPDLDAYRRSTKSGEITFLAQSALDAPDVALTARQRAICLAIVAGQRPAEIARQQQQSRQAVHAQLALIKEKLQPRDRNDNNATFVPNTPLPRSHHHPQPPTFSPVPLME